MIKKIHNISMYGIAFALLFFCCNGDNKDKQQKDTSSSKLKTTSQSSDVNVTSNSKLIEEPGIKKAKKIVQNFFSSIKEKKFKQAVQLIDPQKIEMEIENYRKHAQLPQITQEAKRSTEKYWEAILHQQFNEELQTIDKFGVVNANLVDESNITVTVSIDLKLPDGKITHQDLPIDVIKAKNGQWYISKSFIE